MNDIAAIRKEYRLQSLNETDAQDEPMQQFDRWWQDALHSRIEEVNAMTLVTATREGKPSARIVLLKGYDENGFCFFTNYASKKGQELGGNPQAALVFFWKELERQVRIEGIAEKLSEEESDTYFNSRPPESRLGAWSSPQSAVIGSRDILESNMAEYKEKFGRSTIPRPPHWGGYRIVPALIEFWQGRENRLHDRLQYTRDLHSERWSRVRLAP